MRSLSFPASGAVLRDGKRIRSAQFEQRSFLPTSAVCVVANGVRETLTSLLGTAVSIRLFDPVIPDRSAWRAVMNNALMYRVRGKISDAALILRLADAAALAGALFGETTDRTPQGRTLSPIESTVIERTAGAIAANFGAVCGACEGYPIERVGAIDGFVSFFELLVEKPVEARIGVALSRDPAPPRSGLVAVAQLVEIRIGAIGSLPLDDLPASRVAHFAVGTVLSLPQGALRRCCIVAGGRRLAYGACGVRNGRFAIATDLRVSA